MLTFVIVENALEPEVTKKHVVEYESGKTLDAYLRELIHAIDDATLVISVNGVIISDENIVLQPDDIVSVSCQYEIGAIAAWVATALTGIAAPVAGASIFSAGIGYALVYGITYIAASYLVATGVGMLASTLGLTPDTPDVETGSDSITYSWDSLKPSYNEGAPIPLVYGRHKISGHVINQFTTLKEDGKEHLNMLLAVNDGEVDSISDIRINDQPYTYYNGVSYDYRLGTLDQEPITGFGEISSSHSVNIKLKKDNENTYQTDGNSVQKIELLFTCPNGLYYSNDDGGLDGRSVDIKIYFREINSADWIEHSTTRISGSTNQPIRKIIVIDNLPAAQYEVKVIRTTADSSNFREMTYTYFTSLREIVKEELSYPNLALYSINALATDQLSGSQPSVSCVVEKMTVKVYNPYLNQWVYRSAQNPAWVCYDLLVNHHDIDKNLVLFDEFDAWAAYCEEYIDNEYTKRFICNIVFDTQSTIWENVQRVAKIGRGVVVRRGTYFGVFVDKPETVVSHLFNMANIKEDSFQLKYLPVKDRANAVEIRYMDPDRDFTSQIVAVYSKDYEDSSTVDKTQAINIYASIPRQQVYREASYALNTNKHLTKTITFKALDDSFTATVGDLIYFQHDITNYDDTISGRVVNAWSDGLNGFIEIDKPFSPTVGITYTVLLRLADDTIIEKTIESFDGTILKIGSNFDTVPDADDLYTLGISDSIKHKYRIIQVSKPQNGYSTISALEYSDAVYTDNETVIEEDEINIPVTQEAINVKARERLVYGAGGDFASVIDINWNGVSDDGSNWTLYIQDITDMNLFESEGETEFDNAFISGGLDYGIIKIADTTYNRFTISSDYLHVGKVYKIFICPFGKGSIDTGDNTTSIIIRGKLNPPSDVTFFNVDFETSKRSVLFTWTAVTDIDVAGYEIRKGADWESGILVERTAVTTSASVLIPIGTQENVTYMIKAIDTSGIYSINATSKELFVDSALTTLEVPSGLTATTNSIIDESGKVVTMIFADWDNNSELSEQFSFYVVELHDIDSGRVQEFISEVSEHQFEVIANKEYGIRIKAVDALNNRTAFCTPVFITSTKDNVPPSEIDFEQVLGGFKSVFLRWNPAPEKDVKEYVIEYSSTSDFSSDVQEVRKSATFTTVTELEAETTYYFRIKAIDTSDNASGWSPTANATTNLIESSDIAANSVMASHIYADNLSAIAANLGTVTAGVLESKNWGTDQGIKLDLDNEVIKMGGEANPTLDFDGTNVTIRNKNEGESLELSGTNITLGNTTNGDYFNADSGDISFYRYINGQHHETKSLKRVEYGVADNNTTVTLPGYWKDTPRVMASPFSSGIYNPSYSNQSQTLECRIEYLREEPSGSGIYKFLPKMELVISAGNVTQTLGYTASGDGVGTYSTQSTTTVAGSTTLTVLGSWYVGRIETAKPEGYYDGRWRENCSKDDGYIFVWIVLDGVNHLIYESGLVSSWPRSGNISHTFNVTTASHTVYLKIQIYGICDPVVSDYSSCSVTLEQTISPLPSSTVLATGSMNYIAIGE